jgi:hypothetical protein
MTGKPFKPLKTGRNLPMAGKSVPLTSEPVDEYRTRE